LNGDLRKQDTKDQLRDLLKKTYPANRPNQVGAAFGQIWAFTHVMEKGDWIGVPSRLKKSVIHFGEIKGDYDYHAKAKCPYYHSRDVKWLATDIPRSTLDTDILAAFGALMTIWQIKRNNAEARIRAIAQNGWKPSTAGKMLTSGDEASEPSEVPWGLEEIARDRIAKFIQAKFTGHGMASLVDAVSRAQGYTTHLSPPGPDKGIDILAAPGPLGFGHPRICVQVKSGNSPLDRTILDQLIGVMQNVHADQGLLVSWGGFKTSIDKEIANQFFSVRLWDQEDFITELLACYEKLDGDLRAEIPLKRVWMIAAPEEVEETDSE